jgi:integrase
MAVKNPIFKILRCPGCDKQNWHKELLASIPPCPKCGKQPAYSTDWYIKVIVDGKRHIQAIGRSKQHAESALKKAEAEIFYDEYQIDKEWPLLSEAIKTLYNNRWRKKKDGSYTQRRAELLMEIIGDVTINTIGKKHMQKLSDEFSKNGNGTTTMNRYKSVLRTILKYHELPYKFVEMDPETEGRIYVLSDAEEQQIIKLLSEAPRHHRRGFYDEMPDLVACLIDTGARPNELIKLPLQDINFDTGMATIWVNKTDKPRSIPMTSRVRSIFKARCTEGRTRLFDLTLKQADNAWNWVRKQMGKEEVEDFVLYACRHTSVTRQLIAGVNITIVKEWHGHKTIRTTMRYTHLAPHDLNPALKLLENRAASTIRQQEL